MPSTTAKLDDKATKVLEAIRRKIRPYQTADICMATKLSKAVVNLRLGRLRDAGLVLEKWYGTNGPYWQLPDPSPTRRP